MDMPQPTNFHKALEPLVGEWVGKETMYPSPWDPNGCVADSKVVDRLALDGFAVIQNYEQMRDGVVTFKGHGVFSYDMHIGHYSLMWWDSMGTPANNFVGQLVGGLLTMSHQNPMGTSRTTLDLSRASEGEYTFKMEFSTDGVTYAPFMDATYVRL